MTSRAETVGSVPLQYAPNHLDYVLDFCASQQLGPKPNLEQPVTAGGAHLIALLVVGHSMIRLMLVVRGAAANWIMARAAVLKQLHLPPISNGASRSKTE